MKKKKRKKKEKKKNKKKEKKKIPNLPLRQENLTWWVNKKYLIHYLFSRRQRSAEIFPLLSCPLL